MSDHANPTLDVIRAAMALAERDVELGLVTAEQIQAIPRTRFAAIERKQVAALLKAEGKSNREIAAELGVHHKTVGRDLGDGANAPEDGANAPPKKRQVKAPPADAPVHTAPEFIRNAPDVVATAFDIIIHMSCHQWQRLIYLLDQHELLPVKGTEEGDAVLDAGRRQLEAKNEVGARGAVEPPILDPFHIPPMLDRTRGAS